MKDFVHLHNHSTFSFGDGISQIPDMVKRAKELNMNALALTDHGYGHGLIEFHSECKSNGIKPILGCEMYVAPYGVKYTEKTLINRSANHLVLLAKNKIGYKNLIKLLSIAATDGFYFKPKIDFELLNQYKEGLICSTACLAGPVAVNLYDSNKAKVDLIQAKKVLYDLKNIFHDDLYLEIQFHGMKPKEGQLLDMQSQLMLNAVKISQECGVQLVVTNDCHYVKDTDRKLRNIIIADKRKDSIDDNEDVRDYYDNEGQYYLKTIDQMYGIFGKDYPEAILNTSVIASKIELYDIADKGHRLPKFSEDSEAIFKTKVIEGFKKKYPNANDKSKEWERLMHEVKVIKTLGFKDYFLIVQDFINYAETNGISIGPGRGSAAGSIVSYCLDITTLCPLKNDLLFERFLNPERIALPDIDVDVCKDKRRQVIEYVENKYGSDQVSQIITFNRIKGKGTIRTVGRVLEIPQEVQDAISDVLPKDAGEFSISLKEVVDGSNKEAKEASEFIHSFMEKKPENKDYIESAVALEGTYTHSGVHAAAVVIGPEKLSNILPIQRAKEGTVTQYSMEDVESLGLLKMDFLGLDTLSMISNCLKMICQDNPDGPLKDKNISTLRQLQSLVPDMEDPKVYDTVFKNGRTMGIFQCDSEGLRLLLARIKANKFADISAAIALYRPGPLDSGMVESFIARRRGREPETSWHDELKPYVTHTHGLPIYQEQIMFASQVLCGFSMAKADQLRKVIGKKKKEDILAFRTQFVEAAVKTGKVDKDKAESIYTEIEYFGRYAFNLAHSAAYAVVSYYTGWLKTYYPEYFICALLNKFTAGELEDGNTKKKKNNDETFMKYILECQSMGIVISQPDINESYMDFRVKDKKNISFGLGALKGIGANVQDLITYRDANGRFPDVIEFLKVCIDLGINKRVVSEFIEANVLNFGIDNKELSRLVEGFERPKKSGEGLTKGKKTILDDIRTANKVRDTALQKLEADPDKHNKPLLDRTGEMYACKVKTIHDSYKQKMNDLRNSIPKAESSDQFIEHLGIYIINE